MENLLRTSGGTFDAATVTALQGWPAATGLTVPFRPSRVLLQDYTGIPVLVDLAGMLRVRRPSPLRLRAEIETEDEWRYWRAGGLVLFLLDAASP